MEIKRLLRAIRDELQRSVMHLVFPAKCLHCASLIPPASVLLCSVCASLLEVINPEVRCPTCFNPLEENSLHACHDCLHSPLGYFQTASAFDYEGPAASLVKRLKYFNQPYLAKGIAAFMAAQFDRLEWPFPDAIVPVPLSMIRLWERGYNQSALLSEELGRLLQCPVWDLLKRTSGDFSQAALTLEERRALSGKRFGRKLKNSIEGKVLLVIDDVMTSGMTLRRCGEVLAEGNPSLLYALTFCRTMKT